MQTFVELLGSACQDESHLISLGTEESKSLRSKAKELRSGPLLFFNVEIPEVIYFFPCEISHGKKNLH